MFAFEIILSDFGIAAFTPICVFRAGDSDIAVPPRASRFYGLRHGEHLGNFTYLVLDHMELQALLYHSACQDRGSLDAVRCRVIQKPLSGERWSDHRSFFTYIRRRYDIFLALWGRSVDSVDLAW